MIAHPVGLNSLIWMCRALAVTVLPVPDVKYIIAPHAATKW